MDDIQNKVKDMNSILPGCFENRVSLKALISDLLPSDKLHINLLMNAYDAGIVERLSATNDKALSAMKMIKTLKDDFGLNDKNSVWAVQSWCYILSLNEIAEILELVSIGHKQKIETTPLEGKEFRIRSGTYKAGIDFPAGEICVCNVTQNDTSIFGPAWGVGKNPAKIRADANSHFFHDRVYLRVEADEYLKIEGNKNTEIIVTKVGD